MKIFVERLNYRHLRIVNLRQRDEYNISLVWYNEFMGFLPWFKGRRDVLQENCIEWRYTAQNHQEEVEFHFLLPVLLVCEQSGHVRNDRSYPRTQPHRLLSQRLTCHIHLKYHYCDRINAQSCICTALHQKGVSCSLRATIPMVFPDDQTFKKTVLAKGWSWVHSLHVLGIHLWGGSEVTGEHSLVPHQGNDWLVGSSTENFPGKKELCKKTQTNKQKLSKWILTEPKKGGVRTLRTFWTHYNWQGYHLLFPENCPMLTIFQAPFVLARA